MLTQRRLERATVLFVALVVLSFVLTTIDVRSEGEGVGGTARDVVQNVASPVQRLTSAVTRPVVGFFDGISNIASLRTENDRLRVEIELLEQQAAETEQLQARLEELEKINDLEPPGEIDTVTARVIAVGVSDFDHIRRIDRGLADGVTVGMAVIDERGLVGRIVEPVNNHSATVRLITDPLSTIGVTILSTGEAGWVTGRGDGPLDLKMARASEAIREGDLIVTGGGRFPPDLIVGSVRDSATSETGFLLTTTADPRVDFSRLDFVKVLITVEGDEPVEDLEEGERIPVEDDTVDGVDPSDGAVPGVGGDEEADGGTDGLEEGGDDASSAGDDGAGENVAP